jgi:hypothetical protein
VAAEHRAGAPDERTRTGNSVSGLLLWRFSRFGRRFALNATRWLYFSNHSYSGERRFFVRAGSWRKSFGPRRLERSA